MATPFPIILPANSVLGRLALTAGDAEAIPFAALAAALGLPFLNSPVIKRKPADQPQASNTVLANDNDLFFAIAANEEWVATFNLFAGDVLSSTGLKLAIVTPAGATLQADALAANSDKSAIGGISSTTSGANFGFTTANLSGITSSIIIRVWVLNGTTAGTIQLQWAQSTTSVTNTTLHKGSFMQATRAT